MATPYYAPMTLTASQQQQQPPATGHGYTNGFAGNGYGDNHGNGDFNYANGDYDSKLASRSHDSDESEDAKDDPKDSLLAQLMEDGTPLNTTFQMTTTTVIMLCTFTMAIEVDYYPDSTVWWWWNTIVLLYFCVELGIRMAYYKLSFFACGSDKDKNNDCMWNYFDLLIVGICIVVQWIEPILASADKGSGLGILKIFRIFRILRTLRVLRIFRACTQLNNLALGLLDSLGTVFWIGLLMFMFMLIFAIVFTDLCGNQAKKAEKPGDMFYESKDDVVQYWGTVGTSLATLFQFLTLDGWTDISRQIYEEIPGMWFVFFVYIFVMGFAMLSLLTGVVAERMSEVSTEAKESDRQEASKDMLKFLDVEMKQIADEVASPIRKQSTVTAGYEVSSGMTRDEFKMFLANPRVRAKLQELNALVAESEADEFWACLDRDDDGTLSLKELKAGFMRLREQLHPKDMLRIRYASERVARRLNSGSGENATNKKLKDINSDLIAMEAKLTEMQGNFEAFVRDVVASQVATSRSPRKNTSFCDPCM